MRVRMWKVMNMRWLCRRLRRL